MSKISGKTNGIKAYFQQNPKRQKVQNTQEKEDTEIENKNDGFPAKELKRETSPQPRIHSPFETSDYKSAREFKIMSPLERRKIVAENLNLEYLRIFSRASADAILQRLEDEVEYFTGNLLKVQIFGKWHQIPRKQVSFGDSGLSYKFSGNCIPALEWTPLMLQLKESVESITNHEFNFVLVNRYKDGEDYMGEHRDDEKDLVANAAIASLSFGQSRDFIFRHKDARGKKATRQIEPLKLVLEHGSLLLMNPPTNNYWYHSLPVRKKATNVRVNLTFRKMVR